VRHTRHHPEHPQDPPGKHLPQAGCHGPRRRSHPSHRNGTAL